MKNLLIIFVSTFLFTSCTFMKYMSMDERNMETREEIRSYLMKHNFEYDYSLMLSDKAPKLLKTKTHGVSKYKLENGTAASPIQLRIYDSQGKLVTAYSLCYGPFKKLNILDGDEPRIIAHLPTNYELLLKDEFMLVEKENIQKLTTTYSVNNYDFTFVFYWNIWSNTFSKEIFNEINKFKSKNPQYKISVILINTGI